MRAILNFGHTIGHALEATAGYGRFLHGEAIAIGQVAAAFLSRALIGLASEECERIHDLFLEAGLPVTVRLNAAQRRKLVSAMRLDKKVSAGEVKFVLAKRIGQVDFGQKVPIALIDQALDSVQPPSSGRRGRRAKGPLL